VNNTTGPVSDFARLGFEPDIYSPRYALVTGSMITYLHRKNIAVIPWTVNDPDDMKEYIEMGVDGIITDYPERLLEILGR
jgi:glycerophosphoryl diester phosphodiesterase